MKLSIRKNPAQRWVLSHAQCIYWAGDFGDEAITLSISRQNDSIVFYSSSSATEVLPGHKLTPPFFSSLPTMKP